MSTATHAEYLRITTEQLGMLRGIVADAGERAAGVPAESEADRHVLELLAEADDDGAVDLGPLWGVVHYVLTGKPFDGAATGDPLSEAILGTEHVTRSPMVAVTDADRAGFIADALEAIDVDKRLADANPATVAGGDPMIQKLAGDGDAGLDDAVKRAVADLTSFYRGVRADGCAALVAID